jgi:WD40 repeat protein
MDFSPGNRFLLSSHLKIVIWNMRDGSSRNFGHVRNMMRAQFSPDGRHVVAGCYDGRVLIWEFRLGHLVTSLSGSTGVTKDIAFMQDIFMRDISFKEGTVGFVGLDFNGTLRGWDISGLTLTREGSVVEGQMKGSSGDAVRLTESLKFVGQVCVLLLCKFYYIVSQLISFFTE